VLGNIYLGTQGKPLLSPAKTLGTPALPRFRMQIYFLSTFTAFSILSP
jgi:hypothetical protein